MLKPNFNFLITFISFFGAFIKQKSLRNYISRRAPAVEFHRNLTHVGTTLLVLKAGEIRSDRRGDIECHQTLGIGGSDVHPRDVKAYRPGSQHREEVPAVRWD